MIDDTSMAVEDVELFQPPCVTALVEYATRLIAMADSAGAVQRAVDRCEGRAEGIAYVGGINNRELREVEIEITRLANAKLVELTGRKA